MKVKNIVGLAAFVLCLACLSRAQARLGANVKLGGLSERDAGGITTVVGGSGFGQRADRSDELQNAGAGAMRTHKGVRSRNL